MRPKSQRIGIDAGSKTIKLVVLDEDGAVSAFIYRRHKSDLRETLLSALHDFVWRYGDACGPVAITGSAGIAIAKALGVPFVQEVMATTRAVTSQYPEADCIIELGGEDAKIIYLSGDQEQRMNATCAGGTGGFIETMAHMLGVRTKNIDALAMKATRIYPIASRCAVFAQTDVRPLLNAGAKREDIAASALEAVVQQTIGGLACGRPITGTVVFLGGPLEMIGSLASRFRKALGLSRESGIKPKDAHLYTARGAALLAEECDKPIVYSLSELEKRLYAAPAFEDDLAHLPPLFRDESARSRFYERHGIEGLKRVGMDAAQGHLFLGLDAGSTTVKYVVIDDRGRIVASDYRPVDGKVLQTTRDMLIQLQRGMQTPPYAGAPEKSIARAVVTGYGEDLLMHALRVDAGVVETSAHLRAAQALKPDVSFILDMGGQDIKALWVRDGKLEDAVLNEACSSGCGSFVEGAARSLKLSKESFSEEALRATSPLDLGTKCTVFMTSRIRHAQKIGVPKADIAAGAAYSVVRNALDRVIGRKKSSDMGETVVVQGGAFRSDAVLRAFELVSGKNVTRPREAHLMGAYGCALIAREQWEVAGDETARTQLLSLEELENLNPRTRTERCTGCTNRCTVTIVDCGGRCSLSGNRCERAWQHIGPAIEHAPAKEQPPNAIQAQRRDSKRFGLVDALGARGIIRIGLLNALNVAIDLPFWHTLLRELGFSLAVSPPLATSDIRKKSAESIPSESVCLPAKISHASLYELLGQGVDAVFAPTFERGRHCPVARGYMSTLVAHLPEKIAGETRFLMPHIHSLKVAEIAGDEHDKRELFESFANLAEGTEPITMREFEEALEHAYGALDAAHRHAREANERVLAWVHEDKKRRGIVLDGRAYHYDPEILHQVDEMLTSLGVAVLSSRDLPEALSKASTTMHQNTLWSQSKHLVRTMQRVYSDPQLEIVALRSFGCGFDAVNFDEAREFAHERRRPFTELKIDEMVDLSHIRIRLRTLIELLNSPGAGKFNEDPTSDAPSDVLTDKSSNVLADASSNALADESSNVPFEAQRMEKASLPAEQELVPARAPFPPLDSADLALARSRATGDICFTAQALAARAARMTEDGGGEPIEIPYVCHGCLVDALPYELHRMCGRVPRVTWTDATMLATKAPASPSSAEGQAEPDRLRVGLAGNPLLVFDEFMNEGITRLLEELGCEVVYPDPDKLLVEDVRYKAQMDDFAEQGVKCVIYLQSFGCLKGHVQSRGAGPWFKEHYPDMPVTVLDYDPESSALNRENRIRLAVSSRRERLLQDREGESRGNGEQCASRHADRSASLSRVERAL